jgi:hypothetical protein
MGSPSAGSRKAALWPALPLSEWIATRDTLHMETQIAGKIRLARSPYENHWWHSALYVGTRGLTTSAIPYGGGLFEMRFDFLDHQLVIETSEGGARRVPLAARPVAAFYRDTMAALGELGIQVEIHRTPSETPNPIPFDRDETHAAYDPEYAVRFWRVLVSAAEVLREFRGRFIGKSSPVHFFWGSFDLAVTRFSGRRAPERPGADSITREAYSHEVSSGGFWTGGGGFDDAAFYSYTAPEPAGFAQARALPGAAFYSPQLSEFLLRYDDVRQADSPRAALLNFLQTTYEAGANLAHWDRSSLERTDRRDETMRAS